MEITTKKLAIHSIQKNMLGTERRHNVLNVLLSTGKILRITTVSEEEADSIETKLNYYPSEGRENNSMDLKEYFELEVI
jgi:hypothetical protein